MGNNKVIKGNIPMIVDKAIDTTLNGLGPFKSAKALAASYVNNPKYRDDDERIRALIRHQCLKTGGSGFLTGIGGGLPLIAGGALADIVSSLAVNVRMVGTIALIRGYDLDDESVRVALLFTAIGSSIEEALHGVGVKVGKAGGKTLINKIPKHLLGKINKLFGQKLVTKYSQKGVIQLSKVLPIIGGLVGGGINYVGCRAIGKCACKVFPVITVA